MAEYVDKESVIEWFRPYGHMDEGIPYDGLVTDIREMKAADVAPVVRCKDCKNWLPGGYKSIADPQNPQCGGRCWYSNISRLENDFCSYGERKEADNA